jgi:hypothetical protein
MMNANKALVSLGATLASSTLAKTLSRLEVEDLLGRVGLQRRQSRFLENLLLVSTGALIGAGIAVLFAPAEGQKTRARLGREIDKLSEAATDAVREARAEGPALLSRAVEGQKDERRRANSREG